MDQKCGSVTGSAFMARFDLNHPYMLHCGHEKSDDNMRCASVRGEPGLLPIKLTEQNGQAKRDLWPPLPPASTTCTHHGNAEGRREATL